MAYRRWLVGVLMFCAITPVAVAQSELQTPGNEQYVPRLGDIMNAAQTRHIKLWLAGKSGNWELADFELRQLKASLLEAAVLYSGIPISNVTTLSGPLQSISDAIGARDNRRFASAVGDLTNGCNSCHQAMKRGFIVMRVPVEQPFGDQVFSPAKH
jgi:hypothetical protein